MRVIQLSSLKTKNYISGIIEIVTRSEYWQSYQNMLGRNYIYPIPSTISELFLDES